ncbi:MAG: arsenate reductase [Geobacteraceae bacterium GWC2_58_44]|nr:MAG: arsenate reductase [Geobacteraceae bacterium GWC2_58_44]HBG08282.1 arsenate reductase ArsC [Geobacter sp.]
MQKIKVLFICVHNSARSQMAEAFLNEMAGERFEAQSAGIDPGRLNPFAVKVMAEAGMDISGKETTGVFDLYRKGAVFSYVIAVCDGANAEKCPIFPGVTKRINWSFPDPSALLGTDEEKLRGTREIRDAIKAQIEEWLRTIA